MLPFYYFKYFFRAHLTYYMKALLLGMNLLAGIT